MHGYRGERRRVSSLDTIIGHLREALAHLDQALTGVRAAREQAEDCRERAEALGADGVAERFSGIIDGAEQVEAMLLAGIQHGRDLIAQVDAARGDGASSPTSAASGPPQAVPSPAPGSPVPSAAVEQAGRRLPVRGSRRDPTVGEFNGERISSGRDPASVADLRPERGWPVVLLNHVESHVAARMRRRGLTEGTLTLNNRTCGNRGYDATWAASCDALLPTVLPAGAWLTVWSTEDGGHTWWTKTYTGTGERIQP